MIGKTSLLPTDPVLWLMISGSTYPRGKQISMVPKVFKLSKFDYLYVYDCLETNNDAKTITYSRIMKTCLYNFDPHKPHFYIVKLGFTGVYIIFLISAQNIDCGYSLEPPRRGGSNEYPQSMFWAEMWKISIFFIWKFSFFCGKIFNIFE